MSIIAKNISKSYDGTAVISNFSAEFKDGEHYVIRGASGEGKTTLLHMLCGIIKPDSGEVIHSEAKCCVVFQEDRLISQMSGVKNVQIFTDESREAIVKSAEELGLSDTDMHKKVTELSGGQRRRVALLRAVCAHGTALLLDEPFKGLDELNRQIAMRFIMAKHKGLLILVTHDDMGADMEEIRLG